MIIEVWDSIPHPLNLNLFGEMLTLALAEDLKKSYRCPAPCIFIKHKTKIGRTIVAKKFQLPYTAEKLLPLKLRELIVRLEHSISLLYSEEELLNSLNKTDIATFVIQLYSIISNTQ